MENICCKCSRHTEYMIRLAECMDHQDKYNYKTDKWELAEHKESQGNTICATCLLQVAVFKED